MVFNHLIGVRIPVGPPKIVMKLLRVGKLNQEKPAIIDGEGAIRDLSSIIEDLNPSTFNYNTINLIKKTNIKKLPKINLL